MLVRSRSWGRAHGATGQLRRSRGRPKAEPLCERQLGRSCTKLNGHRHVPEVVIPVVYTLTRPCGLHPNQTLWSTP
eukprot:365775-Chlamydomonas_euryale.AAC.1